MLNLCGIVVAILKMVTSRDYNHILLSLSWMGSYMEIFEARILGENLSFWLKNHQY
jgi:hypothetical protein